MRTTGELIFKVCFLLLGQDVLREKQLHIEQLLKERNLERAEFTRAANQADNAEQQLATLQAEYEHYRAECESKLKEYSTVLSHLNVDRGSLLSQLEDEKRKNEDLQFKFEEAAITKGDIEVSNQTNIHRIKDLEERLTLEKQKVELLEHESSKLFEAEEELVKSREEIDSLKSNLQHLTAKREATAKDNSFSSETSSVITQQIQTKTKNLKIAVTSQSADLEQQLEESKKKSVEHLENCEKYQIEITSLKSELSKVKNILQEQSSSTSERIKTNAELESSLRSEIERLKSDLARKSTELQNKDEELKLKDDEIRGLKTLLETTEIDLKAKTVDVERYQSSKQESEDSYNKEIDYLKKILKEKVVEKEEVEKVSTIEIAKQKSKLEDASRTIALHLEEIQKLKSDLSEAKTDIERNSLDVHERHTRQIAIKESELMAMAAELQQKNEEISKCSIVTTKLEDDICIKNGIIEKLKLELESFKKRSESEERSMLNYTERISVLQLSIGDLQRKLASTEQLVLELQEQKARLENELETVIASSGDYSVELQKMNAAVVEKELMITTVRNEYLQKLQLQQSNEQQLQLQLQRIKEDSERLEHNMREKLRISQESEDMLRQRCESANGEAIKVRDDLMNKVNQLQRLVEEKDFALKVSAGDHTENTRYLKEQLDRTTSELQKTINNCQYKINELSADSINSKNVLAQKTQELIESEAKLKHFMAQSQLNDEELRRLSEEQAKKLQFELSEKNAQVQQFLTELELLKRDCQSRNINIAEKDHRISELSVQLENTLKLVKQLQVDKDNLQLAQMEANKQCAIRNQQCTDLVNQVALLTEKAKLGDKAAQELQMHKVLHQQLIRHLQITETQKQNLVVRLEEEAKKNGETKNCYNMLELAKNIQTSANNEHTQKIMELQQILETTKLELQENQNQLEAQKNEILSLQNELLSAQQSCGPNVNPSNTVSNKHGNTPTLHTQYPAFLQVQLTNLKNSYLELMQRFVGSQKMNVYLIQKLQLAVSNGDTRNVHLLLNQLVDLKNYLNVLKGTVEKDRFKFQKIISYALLSLHRKQVEINVQNNYIKQLQNIYNTLPTQCQLLQSNLVKGLDSELPNESQIELEKTIQLIRVKNEHIQNLKVQLVSIQENCRRLFNTKCPLAPTTQGNPQFVPGYCEPGRVMIKKVPVVQLVRQPCEQVYPDYVRNQPVVDQIPQRCGPSRTIIQKVPVYVPRIVIKEVPRYVNENFKCPVPQVIYKQVPVPSSPKMVVVNKPVEDDSATVVQLKQQMQQILSQCAYYTSRYRNGEFPQNNSTIPWTPESNSQALMNQQQIAVLSQQIQNLMYQLRQCRIGSRSSPKPGQDEDCVKALRVIENQQFEINDLKYTLMTCNKQLGQSPNSDVTINSESHIAYLLSIIEDLKKNCLASNPSVSNECDNIVNQHKTLFTNVASIGQDILQLINANDLPDTTKATMSKTKFENLVMQINQDIFVSKTVPDLQYEGLNADCRETIIQQTNQLNILRNIIQSSLPQLNSFNLSPSDYLNLLRITINNLLAQMDRDTDWPLGPNSIDDFAKCSTALMQRQVQINILKTVIQDMLNQLNNGELSEILKINILKAQIENLLMQLNNNDNGNFRPSSNTLEAQLHQQIQNLVIELQLCRLSKINTGFNPGWYNNLKPGNEPVVLQPGVAEQENIYLKKQIQELLLQLNLLNQNKIPNQSPFYDCKPKDIEIIQLKQQINTLNQQLSNLNINVNRPGAIYNQQCPPPRIIVQKVPVPQTPSPQQDNEILRLKNQIQNLLMQLQLYKSYPRPVPSPWETTPNSNEINLLKFQIYKLNQELNYARLYPRCPSESAGLFNRQCPPPKVILQKVPVPVTSLSQQQNEIVILKNQIQNLLTQLRFYQTKPASGMQQPWQCPDSNEINALKLQISKLNEELNYARLYPQCSPRPGDFTNQQCPPPRIILQKVPVPQISTQQHNEINILKNQIQNLLMQLQLYKSYPRPMPWEVSPSSSPDSNEINALKFQISKLYEELNNARLYPQCKSDYRDSFNKQCPPPRVIVQKVPVPQIPSPQQQNEIVTLKNQIQNLLMQLQFYKSLPRPASPIPLPNSDEINLLKSQIYKLYQELNYARLYPRCPSSDLLNRQCPPPKTFIQKVPVPQTPDQNEIILLKNQIQNLLMQLQSCKSSLISAPISQLPSPWTSSESTEINTLKLQIYKLTQQLNYAKLYPQCPTQDEFIQPPPPPIVSDNLINGNQCPPPRVVIRRVPVPIPGIPQVIPQQVPTNDYLNQAPCIPERIVVPLPFPIGGPIDSKQQPVINSLNARIQQLVIELNNMRQQITVIQKQCQPTAPIVNNEVIYLKQQIQQLLTEINSLQKWSKMSPQQGVIVQPAPGSMQQNNEVNYLRQQILYLTQQLNLANRHPLIYNKQCAPTGIEFSQLQNEILQLRERIQNLLIELDNARRAPNCNTLNQVPANLVAENIAEVNMLKQQVLYLLQQLNNVGISPGALNIPCQPTQPMPQPLPPRVIIKTVPVSQPSPPRLLPQPVPVPQPSPPRIIVRPVPIPQPTPPRVIVKTVNVPVPSPPRIIIRPVPVSQPVPVPQPSPPRVIIKTVTVPEPSPPRIIVRPIPVPQPLPSPPRIIVRPVPISQPVSVPQPIPTVPKVMYIPQPSPTRIIIRPVPGPTRTIIKPIPISQPTNISPMQGPCPPPEVVVKPVPMPQPSPEFNEEIIFLKQQIQSLLVQLNSRSSIIEKPNVILTPAQQYEVNALKIQIQSLMNQITILQNKCFVQPKMVVPPPPPPAINPVPNPDFMQPCPTPIVKYIPIMQQPQSIIKEVRVPISQNCDIPKVIVHNVPVPQPPRIVIKNVPVIQPPKIVIKKVPVPMGSSCPPPEVVVQKVPMYQPPKTLLKEVPIVQPPKIIVKEVPIPQPPEIKIKYVPMPSTENVNCPAPRVIVQRVPVLQPPRTIIKEVPITRTPQIVVKEVPVPQPPKVVLKQVPVFHNELCRQTSLPNTVIKEVPVPVPSQTACNIPKYIIQHVPVVQPPKIIVKTVPVTAPPREVIKMVRVPIAEGSSCPPPQIITQRIPVVQIKTVIKEVPISQPPRIVIKQVPVPQPPQVILKKVPIHIGDNVRCPTPQVIVEKVEVPQPPRVIIKQVPIIQPPRVIVQEVPKQVFIPSLGRGNGNVNIGTGFDQNRDTSLIGCPQAVIKEIRVPVNIGRECDIPRVMVHNVPANAPPRIIVKNVPVMSPPKIIIKKVPVGPNVNCRMPQVIVRPVPVIQPSRTLLKEVQIPQPPRIIIKEVPVVQPQVQVKYVPVPVAQNVECQRPQVIVQKVLVPQPPRTIVTEIPTQQAPRFIVKEVFVPRPPQVIVKEIPQLVSDGSSIQVGETARYMEEIRTLRLEVRDLSNRLQTCVRDSFDTNVDRNSGINNIFVEPIQSLPQCMHQLQKHKVIIYRLNYRLRNFVCSYNNQDANDQIRGIWGGINKNLPGGSVQFPFIRKSPFEIKSQLDLPLTGSMPNNLENMLLQDSSLNLPLPMLNVLKSNPSYLSKSKPKNGLQSLLMKVLHEAFSYTQAALSKCMSAVFIQQLATQTDNSDPEWGGDQQLMEEKQFAEGQIQFLNSIIADMQRKSQEQQARIQLLESGYSPAATEELRLFGVPQVQGHQRPPRIYCDICELFDDHETEDCPLQATGIDVPSTYSRRTRAAPSNRSYCEICEIFGHCTEDCKEDQTF